MINTVSLETAQLLKEAGFKQETYFHWDKSQAHPPTFLLETGYKGISDYAAPTTDELLEELPTQIVNKDGMAQWLKITPIGGDWMVVYDPVDEGITKNFIWCGQTKRLLCEALATMYIWLKKQGLLNDKGV